MQDSINQPAMEQAWGVIKKLSADEQARLEAEDREKALRDYLSRIQAAERNNSIKVALKMLRRNKPIEEISEFTELSFDAISEIALKNNLTINHD
jgi:hypothetical protein